MSTEVEAATAPRPLCAGDWVVHADPGSSLRGAGKIVDGEYGKKDELTRARVAFGRGEHWVAAADLQRIEPHAEARLGADALARGLVAPAERARVEAALERARRGEFVRSPGVLDLLSSLVPAEPESTRGLARFLEDLATRATAPGAVPAAGETSSEPVVNIAHRLAEMARRFPKKPAVVVPAGRANGSASYASIAFEDLERESDRLAWGLRSAGIERGTKTVLMVRPSIELFALTFAFFKLGATLILIDPGLGKRRVLRCLEELEPEALVAIPLAHAARTLLRALRTVKVKVTVGRRWFWGGPTLRSLRAAAPTKPFPRATTKRDDTAAILFTSGSTGIPKGAVYTHGIFDAQVQALEDTYRFGPDEVDLPTFPLFALFDAALGVTAVIPDMDPTRPGHVDPRKIFEAIEDQGVTTMFGSPALLDRIAPRPTPAGLEGVRTAPIPTLRRVISCGAPVPPAVLERMRRILPAGAEVHTPYGATEALPVSTIGSDEILGETAALTREGEGTCVGRVVGEIDLQLVKITDEPIAKLTDDLRVGRGVPGEITVAGPVVTAEYARRPEQTRLAKMQDGARVRHRMGDVGRIDAKGRLWFLGRKAHRVETATSVLFTDPCEAIFNQHPAVRRSALVGIGARPQRPAIVVELAGPAPPTLVADLRARAQASSIARDIETFLVYPKPFPVDIRHNAKISREQLAEWAETELRRRGRRAGA